MKKKLIAVLTIASMLTVTPMAAFAAEDGLEGAVDASFEAATDDSDSDAAGEIEIIAEDSEAEAVSDEASAGTKEGVEPVGTEDDDTDEDNKDEDGTEMVTWTASGELNDGTEVSMSLSYKSTAKFDGRKHVVKSINGKTTKETDSVNPDIEVGDLAVSVNGENISGITIRSFEYKNNMNPGEMQLVPTFAFNSKDSKLQSLLKVHKDLKGKLSGLVKPTKKYDKGSEEYYWTNGSGPLEVSISQIDLTDVEVYTVAQLKNNQSLKSRDNILVWNGGKPSITYKSYTEGSGEDKETFWYATKVTIPGLYYQKLLPSGKVKKIKLRAGGLNFAVKTFSEDGDSWKEVSITPAKGSYDYYVDPESAEVSGKGDYVQPVLNANGITVTKEKKVTYKEDGETYVDYEEYEEVVAKPGYFTGTLANFGANE